MAHRSALITIMTRAAHKAARALVRDFGELENLQISKKSTGDFVTAADLYSEKVIHEALAHARPDYGFIGEEGGETKGADPDHVWVIDPLDGTKNFIHAIPHFSISIALEKQGEPIAGVIYDPIRDELFWAEKGCGAFMNDRRLRVSGRDQLEQATLASYMPHARTENAEAYLKALAEVTSQANAIRRFGSAALDLAYVAAGRLDGFWEMNLNKWDASAGIILIREAGGHVSGFSGQKLLLQDGALLASNGAIHMQLKRLLKKHLPK